MPRFFSLLLAVSILMMLPVPLLTAPASAPLPPPVQSAPVIAAGTKIGVAAGLKGIVKIQSQAQIGKTLESGQPIYLGDTITTDEKSSLQILLLDETIFTIGPSSTIVIDKFVYDPESGSGQLNAKVVKGVFRFVTGKIARKKPSDMKVDLPAGSIGVRGTIVAGETDGKKSTVVLLGPGSKTNTVHRIGQITVGNEVNGIVEEVVVTRPGFGSTIGGEGMAPQIPFQIPAEDLARIAAALEPPAEAKSGSGEDSGGGGDGDGGDASEQAGQDTAAGGEAAAISGGAAGIVQSLSAETAKASQRAAESFKIEDGITKLRDLRAVSTGTFHFRVDNAGLSGAGGPPVFNVKFDLNFGNRTVGGGNSQFSVAGTSGAGDGSASIPSRSFESGDGNASFFYNFNPASFNGHTTTLNVGFFNSGGTPAASATAIVSATSGANTGSSSLNKIDGLSQV